MVLRRPSRTSILFAVLAATFALGAFLIVRSYAGRLEALRPLAGEQVAVVVAAEGITRGSALEADALDVARVPAAYAPPGAASDPNTVAGRTALTDLRPGEPVTPTRLAPEGTGPVAALVPPELRAMSVASTLPPGTIRPGDLVDVLATFGGGRPHTETVVTAVEVLLSLDDGQRATLGSTDATGQVGPLTASGPTLVLLVSPDDAERLAYAQTFAELSVAIAGAV
jgi:pilus assembly protein CpaB